MYARKFYARVNKIEAMYELRAYGCVQTDATTPNIVAAACVLAEVCKRMQQLQTMLGPAVHRVKDTTH